MKRFLPFIALVVMVMVAVATAPQPEPANVIKDFGCMISLAPLGGGAVFTTDSHAVVTKDGNTQFKCTGEIPEHLIPDKAMKVDGLGCMTQGGFTPASSNLYTPSGKAQLTCKINGSTS